VENGIYLLENRDTRVLARDEGRGFLFGLGQARFISTVQAGINPGRHPLRAASCRLSRYKSSRIVARFGSCD